MFWYEPTRVWRDAAIAHLFKMKSSQRTSSTCPWVETMQSYNDALLWNTTPLCTQFRFKNKKSGCMCAICPSTWLAQASEIFNFFPPARSRFLIFSVSLPSFLRPSFLPSFLPAFLPSLILPPREKISVGSVGPQLRTQDFNGHCQVSLGTAGPQPWTLALSWHLSRTSRWPVNYGRQLRSILPKKIIIIIINNNNNNVRSW